MVSNMGKHYVFEDNINHLSSIGRRTLRTTLKCMCHELQVPVTVHREQSVKRERKKPNKMQQLDAY
jgi:hypothetical protein